MRNRTKFLLAGVVLVLGVELYLRTFYHEQLKTQREPTIYRPDSLIGFVPIPNARSVRSVPGAHGTIRLNNHGFIGPDFTEAKAPGVFRIVVVGFSNMEGHLVDADKNCVLQLQRLFRENKHGNIEVINCSIGLPTRSYQQYHYVKSYVGRYQPDLVLFETPTNYFDLYVNRDVYRGFQIEYASNNFASRRVAEATVDCVYDHNLLTGLYDCSYIVRAGAKYYLDNVPFGLPENWFGRCLYAYRNNKTYCNILNARYTQFSTAATLDLLAELNAQLLARGTKLVLFRFEVGDSGKRTLRLTRDLFKRRDLPCLLVLLPSGGGRTPPIRYKDDGHLNEHGHAVMARKIYQGLLKGGFVPAGDVLQTVPVQY